MKRFFYENEWIGLMENIQNACMPKGIVFIFPFIFDEAPSLLFLYSSCHCVLHISHKPTIRSYSLFFVSFFSLEKFHRWFGKPMHLPINRTIPFIALNFLWHIRIKSHFIMSGIFVIWCFFFLHFIFSLFSAFFSWVLRSNYHTEREESWWVFFWSVRLDTGR